MIYNTYRLRGMYMLKPGDIVKQNKTIVVNDNNPERLSIVLFSYIDKDNNLYYCTTPITNATRGIYKKRVSNYYYYMPYCLSNSKTKMCCAKLNSTYLYRDNTVFSTGLKIDYNILSEIYNKILYVNVNDSLKDLYYFIKIRVSMELDLLEDIIRNERKKYTKTLKSNFDK